MKYKWDEEKSVNFANMMQTSHVQALLDEAESLTDCDINQALPNLMNVLNMLATV